MFDLPYTGGGDIPNDVWQKAVNLPTLFKEAVETFVGQYHISRAAVPALQSCNVWAVLDAKQLHIAFSNVNAGGLPRKTYKDARAKGAFTPEVIRDAAAHQVGLIDPTVVSFPSVLIDSSDDQQRQAAQERGKSYVDALYTLLTKPSTLPGYETLQGLLDVFLKDHPDFDRNVFIGMRFRDEGHFKEIHDSIKQALANFGLAALRADDKVYPQDDDLWTNVCVYMMGCRYGVFVFEDIDEREFNPNVPLEYGFMRAANRRVLLLKEKRLPKMPSDITGKLYKPFDIMDIRASVDKQIAIWAEKDLGFTAKSGA